MDDIEGTLQNRTEKAVMNREKASVAAGDNAEEGAGLPGASSKTLVVLAPGRGLRNHCLHEIPRGNVKLSEGFDTRGQACVVSLRFPRQRSGK